MEPILVTYSAYIVISVLMTIWVARTLFRNGQVFLNDIFHGNRELAKSVNRLLVVGFYLLNIGYVVLNLRIMDTVSNYREMFESLSVKLGLVIIVLGVMHFFNLFVFFALRKKAKMQVRPPKPPTVTAPH